MAHFEEYDVTKLSMIPNIIPKTYAASVIDYTGRIPGTIGKKIGIIIDSTTLAPVYGTGVNIELTTTTTPYTAYFNSTTKESGTGSVLADAFITNSSVSNSTVAAVGTFNLSSTSIAAGSGVTITTTCTSAPASYTSSDTSVATISGTNITTLKEGTTTITPV